MPFLAIFRPFWPIWACFEAAHGPTWPIFSDTSQANSGTVLAFLNVPEGLNHLGSPQNTDLSPLRVDLTPTSHPRQMSFLAIVRPFGLLGPARSPLTGQFGRFPATSEADLGTVLAFLSIPEGLNHLGPPQNTDLSLLRVDLTPTSPPRKMPFFGHFSHFLYIPLN